MPEANPVAVLGASNNPERYSYKALVMLAEHGYRPIPVHPALETIAGTPVVHSLGAIGETVHTLSLYVNPARLAQMTGEIIALKPTRVIFNPGTESEDARELFETAGIRCVEACTLVLLRTGQFESA